MTSRRTPTSRSGAASSAACATRSSKSRRALTAEIAAGTFDAADEEAWERLEEALIHGDVGVRATAEIVRRLEARGEARSISARRSPRRSRQLFGDPPTIALGAKPTVILVVGVNGTGKTTTWASSRRSCASTAAASSSAPATRSAPRPRSSSRSGPSGPEPTSSARRAGGDPAAVAYDAVEAGRARGADVVIIDTAGRLHTQANLMGELAKVRRVIEGRLEGAPHETLLVVDATTGQNGLQQARLFGESAGRHRRRADEARRLGPGRRRRRDRLRARPAGEARRRGGGARRPPAVRPPRVRPRARCRVSEAARRMTVSRLGHRLFPVTLPFRGAASRVRGPPGRTSVAMAYPGGAVATAGRRCEMAFVLFTRVPELDLARYDRMMRELELDANRRPARSSTSPRRRPGASRSARSGRRARRPRASSSAGCATRSRPRASRSRSPIGSSRCTTCSPRTWT